MPTVMLNVSATGTASVSTDDYQNYEGDASTNPYLPPVYVGDTYSITVSPYLIFDENESSGDWQITDLSVSSSPYFVYTDSGTSVTIQSGGDSPFTDYFTFLMPGNLLEVLSPQDARDGNYETLISWTPPSDSDVAVIHTFTVSYQNTYTSTNYSSDINRTQNLYFRYTPYINLVKQLVDEGSF